MKENLQNLNNCPENRVAVKEVNEKKEKRIEVASEIGNRSIREEREFGTVRGEDTVNRTEATKALYKVADEIVAWGVSTYPADKEYTKMKPKQARAIWEDVCIIKGYQVNKTEKNGISTPINKFIVVDELLDFHNNYISSGGDWECKSVKNSLALLNIEEHELRDLLEAYTRITQAKGLCTQMEWLVLALEYLRRNTDCLMYLEDKIDTVLRYQFSMDLAIERRLVKELSRCCKTSNKYKNVSIVETLFRINFDSDRLLHLVPTARDIHEVYEMPFDSGVKKLEYMSVSALEDCLVNGDTLQGYKSVCYFRGKLPESVAIDLMDKVNKNRISEGLGIIALVGTEFEPEEDTYVTRFLDLGLGVTEGLKLVEMEVMQRNDLLARAKVMNIEQYNQLVGTLESIKFIVYCDDNKKLGYSEERILESVARLGRNTGVQVTLVSEDFQVERYFRYLKNTFVDDTRALLKRITCERGKGILDENTTANFIQRVENNIVQATEKELQEIAKMKKAFKTNAIQTVLDNVVSRPGESLPVFMDMQKGLSATLEEVVREIKERQTKLTNSGVKNIIVYNKNGNNMNPKKFIVYVPVGTEFSESDMHNLELISRLGLFTGVCLAFVSDNQELDNTYQMIRSASICGTSAMLEIVSTIELDGVLSKELCDKLRFRIDNNIVSGKVEEIETMRCIVDMFKEEN